MEIKEYEYYNSQGELIVVLGQPIEDIIKTHSIMDKRIRELESSVENLLFKIRKLQGE